MIDSEEKLIQTECKLREQQSALGITLIWATCIVCILVGLLPLVSGGMMNENAPNGTSAQIVLSESYFKLITFMSIPFVFGLTAGIILVKSSVKHISKSYFEAPVEEEGEVN